MSRRVQTLLFTDIVGSTDHLRDLGDAAWAALLNRHHEVIRAVLAGHGGREVDTAGDGLLARFDAPALALRAALAAVAAVAPLGIEIRAGLHTGEVQLHGNAATGVGVHLAARVMAEAGPGQVLVSATIRELMAGSGLEFVDLGARKLKGFPEHWRLYALDPATVQGGEAERAAHELAVGDRGPTEVPFPGLLSVGRAADYVGREELLGRLEEARREAAAGGCRAVLLRGEPGIGKTRTAAEVARAAFEKGAIVLYGRCDEDTGVLYQPFAEALDWYTDHVFQPVLGRHPGELSRLQPLLGARVEGLPATGSSDPPSEEYLLFEATRSWLVELSRQQPVVLVVDDLHWATRPVLLLLRHVLRAAVAEGDRVRLLVLGTYRDTELAHSYTLAAAMANVRRLPGVEQHTLTGLSVAELAEFAAQAVGPEHDDDTGQLAETLHAETEGNPSFVEELLRHLMETGTARQPGVLTQALAAGRPLLSISTQEINLDDIGPDETLPAEIVDVVNRGGGELDWTVTTEADWIEVEPQAGFFRLTMRPRPGVNRANVLVRDRGRGGSRTLQVSVRVRSQPSAPKLAVSEQQVDFGTLSHRTGSPQRTIQLKNQGGGQLNPRAEVSNSRIRLRQFGDVLELRVDTTVIGQLDGEVLVHSEGGEAHIPVRALIEPGPVLRIEPQSVDFGRVLVDQRAERLVRVMNAGSGELEWTYKSSGEFFAVQRVADGLRIRHHGRPPGRYHGSVWVRGNGGELAFDVQVEVAGHEPQDQPPDRSPARVGQPRARRRRWVPVAAILLVAMIGVLGAWISRPRPRESSVSSISSVSSLGVLVADFRRLGFTPPEQLENIDLTSLSKSRSFDETKKRWLLDSGFRRALVVKFTHAKGGRRLELRILEVRGSPEALLLQDKFSICSTVEGTKTFRASGITGSKGTECDLRQGPTQEVSFTRGPRLYKLKLWGHSPPKSKDLILKLAGVEATAAR